MYSRCNKVHIRYLGTYLDKVQYKLSDKYHIYKMAKGSHLDKPVLKRQVVQSTVRNKLNLYDYSYYYYYKMCFTIQ